MPRPAWMLTCLATVLAAGCQSAPRAELSEAVAQYEHHDYDAAYADAMEVIRRADGETRCSAAYVAGLSAWKLGDRGEARRRWTMALESDNAGTDGRAMVMLGLLAREEGRHGEAARLLADASVNLEGHDAREAARYAALARSAAHGGSGRAPTGRPTGDATGVFALQAGAFRELDRAQAAAVDVRSTVAGTSDGPVFIVPSTDRGGRTLHLVQFGAFDDRHDADSARRRLGRLEYIVTPIH